VTPDSMVEKVARAVADGFSNGNEQYDEATAAQQDRYDMAARAAIKAALPLIAEEMAGISEHYGETPGTMGPALVTRQGVAAAIRTRASEIGDGL
jgi:hypothetical protein